MSKVNISPENMLLRFEYLFLKEIGYEISLIYEDNYLIDKSKKYYYEFGQGFKELNTNADKKTIVSGESIYNLFNNKFELINDTKKFRYIAKNIINENLGHKSIKSYDILD